MMSSGIPEGFKFAAYKPSIQCKLCLKPWFKPVELQPCQHVFCSPCIANHLACPECKQNVVSRVTVSQSLQEAIDSQVTVHCNFCDWAGRRESVPQHMCRGRQKYLCMKSLQADSNNYQSWFGLGAALRPNEAEVIAGVAVSKVQCYVRSLYIKENHANAWSNLGAALEPTETVEVRGAPYTKALCYVRAIELDKKCTGAWFNLGNSMDRGDAHAVNNTQIYKDTCYLRAVEIDPTFAAAWFNLGLTIDAGNVIDYGEPPNSKEMSAKDCFIKAVEANERFPDAWNSLGKTVARRYVRIKGVSLQKKECFIRALRLKPDMSEAWYNLSSCMKPDDQGVEINGVLYTREECFAKGQPARRNRTGSAGSQASSTSSRGRSSSRRKKGFCACQ